jgi:hypothetical protein
LLRRDSGLHGLPLLIGPPSVIHNLERVKLSGWLAHQQSPCYETSQKAHWFDRLNNHRLATRVPAESSAINICSAPMARTSPPNKKASPTKSRSPCAKQNGPPLKVQARPMHRIASFAEQKASSVTICEIVGDQILFSAERPSFTAGQKSLTDEDRDLHP